MTRYVPLADGLKSAYTIHTLGAGETFYANGLQVAIPEMLATTTSQQGEANKPPSHQIKPTRNMLIVVKNMHRNGKTCRELVFFREARSDKNRDNHSKDKIGLSMPIWPSARTRKQITAKNLLKLPYKGGQVPTYEDEVAVICSKGRRVWIMLEEEYLALCSQTPV